LGEIRTRYAHVALFAFYAQPAPRGSALGNAVNPMRSTWYSCGISDTQGEDD
jgi:hypothetical protein